MLRFVRTAIIPLTLILSLVPALALADDNAAVEQAVLYYVEAIEQGRPELVERGVHPDLAKFGFGRRSSEEEYENNPMTFDQLIELAANMKKQGYVPEDATHEIEIFEVLDQTASVKLTAFWGIDYMHLARYDGEWKIVQVLWQSHPDKE